MNEPVKSERNALIRRVDELAQRQQQVPDEVPLLTEVADPVAPAPTVITAEALEGIAVNIERMVAEQLGPEIDRIIETAHANLKSEIAASIHRAVREALAPLAKP